MCQRSRLRCGTLPCDLPKRTHPRLEPVKELDDVRVAQALEHVELVKYHLLVTLDILFQDDLDGRAARGALGLANDAIGAGAKGATESIAGSGGGREERHHA